MSDATTLKAPRVTDSSLRDGSHPMRHQFAREQVRAIDQALGEAVVSVIEVTHGDGLAGSSIQYGFSATSEMDLISEARSVCRQAKIAALLLPGIGTVRELKGAVERGIQMGRIAPQSTQAGVAEAPFELPERVGMGALTLLMMAHMRPPAVL